EIPNNGIDDDKNGYIDDIHGWNFLGSPDGKNQDFARLEKTRICADLDKRFNGKSLSDISDSDKADFELYQKLLKEVEGEKVGNAQALEQYQKLQTVFPT